MISSILIAAELFLTASAVIIPAKQYHVTSRQASRFQSRAAQVTEATLGDKQNLAYVANVTLNGQSYLLEVDTGSADLVVEGDVPDARCLNDVPVNVVYGSGAESGVMAFATAVFAGHTVENQIFNHVTDVGHWEFVTGIPGLQGVMGLGPSINSVLFVTAQSHQGNITGDVDGDIPAGPNDGHAFVERIFQENTSTPNFVSFALGREAIPGVNSSAASTTFTIGEIMPGMESVSLMPQLPVISVPTALQGNQHFDVVLDGISVNGALIPFPPSVVSAAPQGKLVAVVDTGNTFTSLPSSIVAAIYQAVSGSNPIPVSGSTAPVYSLPCNAQPFSVEFIIGGKAYPIHPLDLSVDESSAGAGAGALCLAGFRALPNTSTTTNTLANTGDVVLGATFLRNAYTLMNYGNFVSSTDTAVRAAPFMQFLSTTDPVNAALEYGQARNITVDAASIAGLRTGDSNAAASAGELSDSTTDTNATTTHHKVNKLLVVVIVLPLVVFGLLFGVLLFCCIRKRHQRERPDVRATPFQTGQLSYAPYSPRRNRTITSFHSNGDEEEKGLGEREVYEDPFEDKEEAERGERMPLTGGNQLTEGVADPARPGTWIGGHSPRPSFDGPELYDPPVAPVARSPFTH
ncbi:acid protease [Dacryopinax primogenitus]|uniref:Acid protease n=1 Tax=Dacryopinax primogenitus (strain DJM 731) TaxID=1858805 RepID=M5FQL1_DACPD|nr:acid protease [Dacryopinax primogenitus]EJT97813.1 acid protease [Dacryopinax primogenitus]